MFVWNEMGRGFLSMKVVVFGGLAEVVVWNEMGRSFLSMKVVVVGGLAEVEIIFRKDGLDGSVI